MLIYITLTYITTTILWIIWSRANSAYFINLNSMILPYYTADNINVIMWLPPLFSLHVVLGFWAYTCPLFCTYLSFVLWCFICCKKIWFGKINLTTIFSYQQPKQETYLPSGSIQKCCDSASCP
jgi:hypothetical protein